MAKALNCVWANVRRAPRRRPSPPRGSPGPRLAPSTRQFSRPYFTTQPSHKPPGSKRTGPSERGHCRAGPRPTPRQPCAVRPPPAPRRAPTPHSWAHLADTARQHSAATFGDSRRALAPSCIYSTLRRRPSTARHRGRGAASPSRRRRRTRCRSSRRRRPPPPRAAPPSRSPPAR